MIGASTAGSAIILAFALATPVAAQSLDDKYWVEIGAYLPDVDSKVRVAAANRPNIATTIDLESDLSLADRKTLPQANIGVRFKNDRWSLTAEAYSLQRTAGTSLQRDIVFDDAVYSAGVHAESSFDSTIYRAALGYDFVRKPNTRIGGALGLHATRFDVSIMGDAQLPSGAVTGVARRRDVLAPLPTLGLYASHRALRNVTLSARADYLSLSINDYSGRLLNAQAAVTWRVTPGVGIGAMYRHVRYRVDVDKTDWNGRLEYAFSGPAVFLQFGFQ